MPETVPPRDADTPARPINRHRAPEGDRSMSVTRRRLLLGAAGVAGAAGLYGLDRADPLVHIGHAIASPFESHTERKLLEPEKYGINVSWLPPTVSRWNNLVVKHAKRYRIDPLIPAFSIAIESAGYSKAQSPAGAKGLMQITESAEKDALSRLLIDRPGNYDILDPETNIEFGVATFAGVRDAVAGLDYDRSLFSPIELIAAGYNGGFTGQVKPFASGHGMPADETLVYSRDMMNMYREQHAADGLTYKRWLERGGQRLLDAALAEK